MYGNIHRQLAILSAAVVLSGVSAIAPGQEIWDPYAPPLDPAYAARSSSGNNMAETDAYLISNNRQRSKLADEVAALKEELQKIKDKQAADEKKAAGRPSVTAGGRFYADWTAYDQNAASITQIGDQQNGFEFRRARIFLQGEAFNVIDYKVQYDFADNESALSSVSSTTSDLGGFLPSPVVTSVSSSSSILGVPGFRDVYLTIKELPVLGHVRVGHYKEPFGLEQLTSSKYITLIERGLLTAFTPERNVGVMAFDHSENERMTWAIGAFISENDDDPPIFRDDDGGTALTMRYTCLPWYDEATEGRGLLHLGLAYSYRDMADDTVSFRERPEAHLGSRVVDTGTITGVPNYQQLGLEAAFVYGPWSVQSEYMAAFVDRTAATDVDFNGFYVYTSYFLTGENRNYKRTAGTFDRIKPYENFFRVRTEDGSVRTGWGAWEIGYRFSTLDLNDTGVAGGNVSDHTIGLNWYLNPYTRLMFNYVNSDLRSGGTTGNMNIFETRAQIDF